MKILSKKTHLVRFVKDIQEHTPFLKMILLLIVLWWLFAITIFLAERGEPTSTINTYGDALYWCIAAFTTAGIANMPESSLAIFAGGLWMVMGSMIFFGAIVATVTTYFMRPMQRPHKKIINAIEYNLEQLNELSTEELDLLKETVNTLIDHVEKLKSKK